jgi:glycosyltransferase EpsF
LGLRGDVPRLMGLSDVFLFPSFFEGFGLAALEANAAALPVVASRVPGLTEAVVDGQTALLHDVQDVDGMVRSVTRLLSEPEYSRQMGDAGRQRVEADYSLDASARRLRELYRLCVS